MVVLVYIIPVVIALFVFLVAVGLGCRSSGGSRTEASPLGFMFLRNRLYGKLVEWERQGYDVAELRKKYFSEEER